MEAAAKRQKVVHPTLPPATEATLLALGGAEAAASISRAAAAAGANDWPEALCQAQASAQACWAALHTGHWAGVDPAWRTAYMVAAYYVALAGSQVGGGEEGETVRLRAALRALDLGLMLGGTSFRRQLLLLAEMIEAILEGKREAPAAAEPPPGASHAPAEPSVPLRALSGSAVARLRLPPLIYFYNEFMVTARPAVLQGAMQTWPAMSSRPWADLSYLKRVAGHRTVPVERGSNYLATDFDEQLMSLEQFIETHIERRGEGAAEAAAASGPTAYLAQHRLFEQVPRLREDIQLPDYCALSTSEEEEQTEEEVAINAWLGPRGTASPLHFDRVHNLLAQVVGSKYVRLYAPSHSERLYPHPDGPHMNSSQIVDPEDYDHARFPRFAGTPYVDLVLSAGEMLYIPPRWWHFVESRETSFSVSFWWGREYAFGPEEIPP